MICIPDEGKDKDVCPQCIRPASVASSGQGGEQQEGSVLLLESTEAKGNNSGRCTEAGCSGYRVGSLCSLVWLPSHTVRAAASPTPAVSSPPWISDFPIAVVKYPDKSNLTRR